MNNNMEEDPPNDLQMYTSYRAIECLRSVSQVNNVWRKVALKSPTLWANVIDMDFLLSLKNTDWTLEVMTRTQGLPLTMRWRPMKSSEYAVMRLFFRQYWARIRKLELVTYANLPHNMPVDPSMRRDADFAFFIKPAPLLESITCVFPLSKHDGYRLDLSLGALPFGNNAPLLKHFACNVTFGLHSSWLADLRSITLDTWTKSHSIQLPSSELYNILQRTPALEKLTIKRQLVLSSSHDHTDNVAAPLRVSLPNLRHIEISGNQLLEVSWKLLDNIVPSSDGCNVVMNTKHHDVKMFESTNNVLLKYLNSSINKDNPTSLAISAIRYSLHIHDHLRSRSDKNALSRDSAFDVNVVCTSLEGPNTLLAAFPASLLKLIYTADYSGITDLDLDLSNTIFDPRDIRFVRFIQSFSSVQILRASSETIHLLSAIPSTLPIFPRLHTLKMTNLRLEDNSLNRFLNHQKVSGTPLRVFEFAVHNGSTESGTHTTDFTFLNKFVGLTVKYTYGASQGVFVCGGERTRRQSRVLFLAGSDQFPRWAEYENRFIRTEYSDNS